MPIDLFKTALALPLKRALASAAALFCLCPGGVLAAPENLPSAPRVDAHVDSLGDFNWMFNDQLRPASRYTLDAYLIALERPLCSPDDECVPAFALFSDAPPERIADERVTSLIRRFPLYEYNTRSMENMLNETRSGHAFLTLNAERTARLEAGKRYRLRIRATQDSRRYRTGFVVEDFSAAPASATPAMPAKNPRVYSVVDFNRERAPVIHTVKAYVVALMYPQCKPGGVCPPVCALLSDTPLERIADEKVKTLIRQFGENAGAAEKALQETRSGHAFRAIDLKANKKSGQLEPGKRYRLRIRVNAMNDSRAGLVLEDFSPQTQ
ncbi:MAG: hypothetical protein LBD68_10115 [Zoogloeaceae bacterium]|jgi:hypothetical protein|nr:hypothetical protein [Zoogloeaceae bacterium]